MKIHLMTGVILALCGLVLAEEEGERIHYDWGPQGEVLTDENVIDGKWGLVGASKTKNSFHLDTTNTYRDHNVYKFWASPEANRIELCECYATESQVRGYSRKSIEKLMLIKVVYGLTSCGEYGDTISYRWYTRFPRPLTNDSGGIIAQWHGRPDRTTVQFPDGAVKKLSVDAFLKLSENMEWRAFQDDEGGGVRGINKATGKETGHILDGSAGGPIAALSVSGGYLKLITRSGADPVSTNSRPKIKPSMERPDVRIGNRTGALIYCESIERIPIDQWIQFRVNIRFSDYADNQSRVLSNGFVKVWVEEKQVVDWKGNIGKNDYLGPYFKFGIYKPGITGLRVHHCGYERTILQNGRRQVRTMAALVE